jgi:hypothetical protein
MFLWKKNRVKKNMWAAQIGLGSFLVRMSPLLALYFGHILLLTLGQLASYKMRPGYM